MDLSKSKYLTSKNAKGETVTMKLENCQFQTRQEMIDAMQAKEYTNDPEYRALVQHMLRRPFADEEVKQATQSGPVDGRTLNRALSDPAAARKMEDGIIAREAYQKMFMKRDEENGGLLYENSPGYRRQVQDWLRENSASIDAQIPAGTLVDRNQPQHRQAVRVTFGEGANSNLFNEIKQGIKDKADAAEKERIAEQHRRVDAGESTDVRDLGGKTV